MSTHLITRNKYPGREKYKHFLKMKLTKVKIGFFDP